MRRHISAGLRVPILLVVVAGLGMVDGASAQRLPQTVVPESYDLTFEPNLEKATFTGDETMRAKVLKPTTVVTLNAAELELSEVTISSGGKSQKATVALDAGKEQATLTVKKQLSAGPVELHIRFAGILNDKLRGFYLSKSDRRRYAVTQFEPTDARRAFPCFDEPAFKALFRISLIVDKGDTAISNGKIVSDTPGPGDGKHTLKFSPSAKMSSYLVAMTVGDFVCREGGVDGIPIRVCVPPEQKEMTKYALEASENILKYFNKYYAIKYPYGKLDHIEFPDFSAGAMENVAAITYRDSALLIDDKTASYDAKKGVAETIAHEMAHQWFGDLVTMKWWNDIWLNEGFATWMAPKPLEAWQPQWNLAQGEISQTMGALSNDMVASVRTVRANADTPADIQALFDGVAYGKAASVLRMVEAYVGPEVFQKGVNAYLAKHANENATAEDFWNQITETSGKPVDKIMRSFTEQPGAPLVHIKSSCHNGKTEVTLRQQRYFADAAKLTAGSEELWVIPVSLMPSVSRQPEYHLLTKKEETITLPGCSEWVFGNAGAKGFYITSYEPEAFARMSKEVESSFSLEERLRIPNDAWALVRVGQMKIGDYLDLIQKMKGERSREVVQVMTGHISGIHDYFVSAGDRPSFEKWVRDLLQPLARELGETPMAGEPAERQALRADVFELLARYGRDPELIEKARATAERYMQAPESVDAGLAGRALEVAAMNGDAALYDKYVAHLKAAKSPEEHDFYLFSLGSFPEVALTTRTFELVLGPEVKNQDMYALYSPLVNYETQAVAWELFKTDFPAILKKVDASDAVGFAQVAGVFCDANLRDDSQKFFAEQKLPGTARVLQNQKDFVNVCIQVRDLQQKNLSAYLGK
ncbi:MAG TPA: M1 family aminopeptidase [Candidatus Limnocylindrales bacterium]|nr:M1 family aminopeptidase [Candidatus Limnocylindrales bacterium]